MIIWWLGCFFIEGIGERIVDALKKKSVRFYVGFQIFLKHSILEIKSNFGINTTLTSFVSFLFLGVQIEEQLGSFC